MTPALSTQNAPDLLEYSVVYTERALNHMSPYYMGVMKDISRIFKSAHGANSAIVLPGSGTFGMEAVARQFATDKRCLIIRNGWFSFRWTQIIETCRITSDARVITARQDSAAAQAPFAPPPIDEVVAAIREYKPEVVFAPHVETAAGIILPDDYIQKVGAAVHEVGGLFVLDCVAAGTVWADMVAGNIDVLVSAPQKNWSSNPCCALIGLSERARKLLDSTTSTSFACDLKVWQQVMETYENGGHAYHATMPTNALASVRDAMLETEAYGFQNARKAQETLGKRVRELLERNGFPSVAAEGFQAPGVVVSYTTDPEIQSGKKFSALGLRIASGVPLKCGEPDSFRTFRLGLFGLDKLQNQDGTLAPLEDAIKKLG